MYEEFVYNYVTGHVTGNIALLLQFLLIPQWQDVPT